MATQKKKTLLVVECQSRLDWSKTFEGSTLADGTEIEILQGDWDSISVTSYADCGPLCTVRTAQGEKTATVHFVLLRSVTRSIKGQDSRNKLFGLIHANLPSVNSLMSAYVCLEKPTVYAGLKSIQQRLGNEAFPLIDQNFYSSHRTMLMTPEYPFVAKVAHTHAGYGKMRFMGADSFQYADFCSVVAVNGDYVTLEPFIEWDYDMRIQKIGPHYRVFKQSGNWKGNTGNMSIIEDGELTPRYKLMADECAKLFGGLDIIGLDLVISKKDGKEYILELNDTAIGLVHKYCEEDMGFMRDVVISKMNDLWVLPAKLEKAPISEEGESKVLREEIKRHKSQIEKLNLEKKKALEQLAEEQQRGSSLNHPLVWVLVALVAAASGLLFGVYKFDWLCHSLKE